VVTGEASALAQSTATLNATVNPNGAPITSCKFEYGPTASYGSSASCSSLPGSESVTVGVAAPVTGLSANSTYHFHIVAANSLGASNGSDQTFKTLPNAPTTVTGETSSVTQTTATLTTTANHTGGEVSKCKTAYSLTTSHASNVN
jgi:hypothetical protein